jgi:hypothetical protein
MGNTENNKTPKTAYNAAFNAKAAMSIVFNCNTTIKLNDERLCSN